MNLSLKRIALAAVGTAALMSMSTAANAAEFITLNQGPDGLRTWVYGNSQVDVVGTFTNTFSFTTIEPGFLQLSLSEVAGTAVNNIEFTSVVLNGVSAAIFSAPGANEPDFASLLNLATGAGSNTLVITGTSGGNGVFGGTIAFSPGAVPEPSTWAMMLVGFGAVGYSMRRRKVSYKLQQAI